MDLQPGVIGLRGDLQVLFLPLLGGRVHPAPFLLVHDLVVRQHVEHRRGLRGRDLPVCPLDAAEDLLQIDRGACDGRDDATSGRGELLQDLLLRVPRSLVAPENVKHVVGEAGIAALLAQVRQRVGLAPHRDGDLRHLLVQVQRGVEGRRRQDAAAGAFEDEVFNAGAFRESLRLDPRLWCIFAAASVADGALCSHGRAGARARRPIATRGLTLSH